MIVTVSAGETAEPIVLGENAVSVLHQAHIRTRALTTLLEGQKARRHRIAAEPAAHAEAGVAAFLHEIVRVQQAHIDDAGRGARAVRPAAGALGNLHPADQLRIDIGALVRS